MRPLSLLIIFTLLFSVGNFSSSAQDLPGRTVTLNAGTPIRLKLAEELNSQRNREGDEVIFTVVEDLEFDGRMYLVEGTPVIGWVRSVRPSRSWGRRGNIEIEVSTISPLYSDPIPLTGEAQDTGESNTPYAVGATILIGISVVGVLAGGAIEGHDAVIDKGTEFTIFTASDGEIMDISAERMRQYVDAWTYSRIIDSFYEYTWDDNRTIIETLELMGYSTDSADISIYEMEDNRWSVNVEVVTGTEAIFSFKPFEEAHLGKFSTLEGENELGRLIIYVMGYDEDDGNDFDDLDLPF